MPNLCHLNLGDRSDHGLPQVAAGFSEQHSEKRWQNNRLNTKRHLTVKFALEDLWNILPLSLVASFLQL